MPTQGIKASFARQKAIVLSLSRKSIKPSFAYQRPSLSLSHGSIQNSFAWHCSISIYQYLLGHQEIPLTGTIQTSSTFYHHLIKYRITFTYHYASKALTLFDSKKIILRSCIPI